MNSHNNTRQHNQNLAHSILNIAQLPSAPAFDWATQAARSITPIHPSTTLGVIIARHNTETDKLRIEASGVHSTSHTTTLDARCPLERLGSSTINLNQHASRSGYIAPAASILPQWFASKASLPWVSPHPNQTLIGYAPLTSNAPQNYSNTDPDPKETLALLLLACPHSIQDGPINPTTLATALAALAHKAGNAITVNPTGEIPWLTQREQTILNHLIEGDSVRVIAEIVDRSPHTVHDHVKNLHRKLGASSRGQLIARALGHSPGTSTIRLLSPIIDPELIHTHTQSGVAELKPAVPMQTPLPNPAISRHPTAG